MIARMNGSSEAPTPRPTPYVISFAMTGSDELPIERGPGQHLTQTDDAVDAGSIGEHSCVVDVLVRFAAAPPMADRVEVLERETKGIHLRVTARARWIVAVFLHARAH
jgi:hypothetical protein